MWTPLPETALVAVLSFAGGAFVGHRFSLARDRRQELNAAAAPVRAALLNKQRDLRPDWPLPSHIEIDTFEQLLPRWQRKRFNDAWTRLKRYDLEARYQDSVGQMHYHQTDRLVDELTVVLQFTRMR